MLAAAGVAAACEALEGALPVNAATVAVVLLAVVLLAAVVDGVACTTPGAVGRVLEARDTVAPVDGDEGLPVADMDAECRLDTAEVGGMAARA